MTIVYMNTCREDQYERKADSRVRSHRMHACGCQYTLASSVNPRHIGDAWLHTLQPLAAVLTRSQTSICVIVPTGSRTRPILQTSTANKYTAP